MEGVSLPKTCVEVTVRLKANLPAGMAETKPRVGLLVGEVDLPEEVAAKVEAGKVQALGVAAAAEGDEFAWTHKGGARRAAGGEVAEVDVFAGKGEEIEEDAVAGGGLGAEETFGGEGDVNGGGG